MDSNFLNRRYLRRGSSLVDMAIGLAVVSILATVVAISSAGAITHARIQQEQGSLSAIAQACRQYQGMFGQWPVFAHDLVDADMMPASVLGFQPIFTRQGQTLIITDAKGHIETAYSSDRLASLIYARNNESQKFKSTGVFTY